MTSDGSVLIRRSVKARQFGLPKHTRDGDAGIDIRTVENTRLEPKQRKTLKTGLFFAIPAGYVGLVKDRSGLAARSGIHTLAGVVDSNYRGELKIVLLNTSNELFDIKAGDRIAQILIVPVCSVNIREVSRLNATNRRHNGWGSTGIK